MNRTAQADGASLLAEARTLLALGRAAQAEQILEQASARAPSLPEPWLIRLEICRVENRLTDALLLGQRAIRSARTPASTTGSITKTMMLSLRP